MKVSIIPWIVRKLKLCFALVEDGDTASQNIAQGKFVIWKGVCCKAASAITAGETLSGTNLPAINDGALNNIGSDISTLNSKLTLSSPISNVQYLPIATHSASGNNTIDTVVSRPNQDSFNFLVGESGIALNVGTSNKWKIAGDVSNNIGSTKIIDFGNANRDLLGSILPATSSVTYRSWSSSTITFTFSISGTILTITPSATLWGLTTLIINHN